MQAFPKKRPSGAMVVAVLALAFAVVGTAVAANDGAVSPKLTKSKVKEIANKQIDKAAPNLSVASAEEATTADEAKTVGGLTPHKLFTKIPTGTGATTVLEANGLKLSVACPAPGRLQFTATTSVDSSIFASNLSDLGTPGGERDSDFDRVDTANVLRSRDRGEGTFTYSQPDGTFVSGTFEADDSATFSTFDGCVVVGTAFSG